MNLNGNNGVQIAKASNCNSNENICRNCISIVDKSLLLFFYLFIYGAVGMSSYTKLINNACKCQLNNIDFSGRSNEFRQIRQND